VVGDISLISSRDGSGAGKSRAQEHAPQNPDTGEIGDAFDGLGILDRDIPF
jgi:hypothetical protein